MGHHPLNRPNRGGLWRAYHQVDAPQCGTYGATLGGGVHCQTFIGKGAFWFFFPTSHSSSHNTRQALPVFEEALIAGVRKRSVTAGGGRRGMGRVGGDGDGVAREARPPLDKLEFCRLLRLARLGWSQVCSAAIPRTGQPAMLSPSPPHPPTTTPTTIPFFVVLICFCLARSKAGREWAKMMSLRLFWRMVYVHGVTGRTRQRFCDDIIK